MSYKDKVLDNLRIQESIEGKSDSIELIKLVLNSMRFSSQWQVLVNVKHYKYEEGKFHRFYYPTQELLNLVNQIKLKLK